MDYFETAPRILVVEDDGPLRSLLCRSLKERGFALTGVGSGAEVDIANLDSDYDLLVLDIMLPGANGLDICRAVRRQSAIPIIIISARQQNTDRIVGLELGADDYLSKPVDVDELVARVRAVLRRVAFEGEPVPTPRRHLLRFDGWSVDRQRREVVAPDDTQVVLSGAEFDLLCVLIDSSGRVVGREYLLEQSRARIAARDASDRSIDVLVSRLRRKLGAHNGGRDLIKTVRGTGYIFTGTVARS